MRLTTVLSVLAAWTTLAAAAYIPSTQKSTVRRQVDNNADESIWFPYKTFKLKNARVAEHFEASVAGLVLGPGNATVIFEKVSGRDWVNVSPDGHISGTPMDDNEGATRITVRATSASKSTAVLDVSFLVGNVNQKLVGHLGVMSYNLWYGGVKVDNYHEKQLRFIMESGADVIGLQESVEGGHATRLSKALGWDLWASNRDTSIISRYPIVERYNQTTAGGGVRISLNGDSENTREINFWNAHPPAYPYGPYGFCFDNNSTQEVLDIESSSGRTGGVAELLDAMASQLASSDDIPVILTGDMNAPSHLDYVEGLREKHCGVAGFDWPTSVLPIRAGLLDSYRAIHPDPMKLPGTTWSPIYLFNEDYDKPEPLDRIDFVYATKQLKAFGSNTTVARGKLLQEPNQADNEWTSDHRAVITWFQLP